VTIGRHLLLRREIQPNPHADVDRDVGGNVVLNRRGLSVVVADWRQLPGHLLPEHLDDGFNGASGDAAFRNYAELLHRRHQYLLAGREEGPEMEEIEEALSAMWETLDEAQRHSLNGIGSDLNWVRRRGAPPQMADRHPP
jgi:hypothetical protein